MNDWELIELAAQAADLPECGWMGSSFMYIKDNKLTDWNPLESDGDALRLAVHLNLGVSIPSRRWVDVVTFSGPLVSVQERGDQDVFAATRRAIVRAAAEVAINNSQA